MSEVANSQDVPREVVTCTAWKEFAERYADDLTRGGLFLPTTAPHVVLGDVDVVLRLPAGHEVILRGRVVHVIDEAHAAAKGMPPGIGVEFVQLDAMRLQALNQLLQYARSEGCLEQPRFTFAQWLAQNADFQAPRQIMASLPPEASPLGDSRAPRQRRRTDRPDIARPMKSESSQSTVRRRSRSSDDLVRPDETTGFDTNPGDGQRARAAATPSTRARATTSTRPARSSRTSMRRPEAASTGKPEAEAEATGTSVPPEPPHPTRDPQSLKLGMTHLAHKRFKEAEKVLNDMLMADGADADALRWLHTTRAREALSRNDNEEAIGHYRRVQSVDPSNREAKDKIAVAQRNAKLETMPFGRFFAKK